MPTLDFCKDVAWRVDRAGRERAGDPQVYEGSDHNPRQEGWRRADHRGNEAARVALVEYARRPRSPLDVAGCPPNPMEEEIRETPQPAKGDGDVEAGRTTWA